MDRDGYGYEEHQSLIDRLLADLRTLGPSGIERIAGGYVRLAEDGGHERFHQLEKEALHAIEQTDLGPRWDELRNQIRSLTEGGASLQAWRAEHGETGHHAEQAVYAGALGLLALPRIRHGDFLQLVEPLAEALPWVSGVGPQLGDQPQK
jgi:hypothetical protein